LCLHSQKKVLGSVQGAICRIDVDLRDARGARYTKTAIVKGKAGATEELPLYTNHEDIIGEVSWLGTTKTALFARDGIVPNAYHMCC